MSTPVLTKRQKKLSLSAKKQKKETIKNVIANPHEKYWPLVCGELESLTKVLRDNLPRVKSSKINVPWNILKDIPKEDRRTVRDTYIQQNCPPETVVKENNLIFGVNEVTKSLESNSLAIVLVAEVNARILVQHVFDLCVLYVVPVLVVPEMKLILKECCGLESIAIGIRKDIEEGSNLNNIVKEVTKVYKNYPPSLHHINSNRSKKIDQNHIESIVKTEDEDMEESRENIQSPKCHLYRKSLNERVFIPKRSESMAVQTNNCSAFISFNNSETVDLKNTPKISETQASMPLLAKKFKGVKRVAQNHPPSLQHINPNKRKKRDQNQTESIVKSKKKRKNTQKSVENIQIPKYHLYKSSSNERVFTPKSENVAIGTNNCGDFLSFNNSEIVDLTISPKIRKTGTVDLTNSPKISKTVTYKPLVVKRIKGNKNRRKNKIDQLKKKK